MKVELEIFHDSEDLALLGLIRKAKELAQKPEERYLLLNPEIRLNYLLPNLRKSKAKKNRVRFLLSSQHPEINKIKSLSKKNPLMTRHNPSSLTKKRLLVWLKTVPLNNSLIPKKSYLLSKRIHLKVQYLLRKKKLFKLPQRRIQMRVMKPKLSLSQ